MGKKRYCKVKQGNSGTSFAHLDTLMVNSSNIDFQCLTTQSIKSSLNTLSIACIQPCIVTLLFSLARDKLIWFYLIKQNLGRQGNSGIFNFSRFECPVTIECSSRRTQLSV